MPIQVAQLSIQVTADASTAMTTLGQLNQAWAQGAATAQAAAVREVQGEQQLAEAISAVVLAQRAQTAAIQQGSAQIAASVGQVSAQTANAQRSMSTIGTTGVQGIYMLNSAMMLSGQAMGPLNQGLMLVAMNLSQIPAKASLAQRSIMLIGTALTVAGALIIKFSSDFESARARLANSLQDAGKDVADYGNVISEAERKGEGWGRSHTEVDNSLSVLARTTSNAAQLTQAFGVAADIAAARQMSLSAATDLVARAMEGQSRALKVLGINETLVSDPAKKLAEAKVTLANRTTAYHNALDSLAEAQQRYSARIQENALKSNQMEEATKSLTRAQQSYQDLVEKFALEDAAPKTTHAEQAMDTLAQAQQHLADTQALQDAAAKVPAIDHVAEAQRRLAAATARLNEQQNQGAANGAATAEELTRLAQAQERVIDAEVRLRDAKGQGIAVAQNQLQVAVAAQRTALDNAAAQHTTETENTASSISARNSVIDATEALARAQAEAALEASGQSVDQLRDAYQLRDAKEAVRKAVEDLAKAQQQDASEAQQQELQRTVQLREATNRVADAEAGVTQALRDQQSQAIQTATAHLAVGGAARSVAAAYQSMQEAQQRVTDLTKIAATQGQHVLDLLNGKVHGSADDQEKTWKGLFERTKARFTDWISGMGTGLGTLLLLAYPVVNILGKIGGWIFGGGAAEGAEVGAAEVGGEGILGGLAAIIGMASGVLEVVGIVAALAGAAYLVYRNWSTITGFFSRMMDDIGTGMLRGIHWIESLWAGLPGDILRNIISFGLPAELYGVGENMVIGLYNGAVGFWNSTLWPFIASIPGRLWDGLNGIYENMMGKGEDIINGLWAGVVHAYNWVIDHAGGLVGFFVKMVENGAAYLESHSPSMRMHRMGQSIMQGLAQGMAADANKPNDVLMGVNMKLAQQTAQMGKLGVNRGGIGAAANAMHGAQVIVQNTDVRITNQGSVIAERDLARRLRDGLISAGHGQGGQILERNA